MLMIIYNDVVIYCYVMILIILYCLLLFNIYYYNVLMIAMLLWLYDQALTTHASTIGHTIHTILYHTSVALSPILHTYTYHYHYYYYIVCFYWCVIMVIYYVLHNIII